MVASQSSFSDDRVYVVKMGRTYHERPDCFSIQAAQNSATVQGLAVHPVEAVSRAEAKRLRRRPCQFCA